MQKILTSLFLILLTSSLHAEDLLSYHCSALKITVDENGRLVSLENTGEVSGTRAIVPYNPPFGNYVDQPTTLDSTGTIKSNIVVWGVTKSVQNTLSVILTRPSTATGTKWGICQFSMNLTIQEGQTNTFEIKGVGSTSLSGGKSTPSGSTSCRLLTIEQNEEFSLGVSETTLSTAREKFAYNCSYKIKPAPRKRGRGFVERFVN